MNPKVNWRKSATKDVRPFFGAASLEDCLHRAELQIKEDGPFSAEPAYVIEPTDAPYLSPTVRLNFDLAALSFDSVKRGDLVLALTASQPFMKKTIVVASHPIDKDLPQEIALGEEILAMLGGGSHINIDLALCLKKKLPQKAGTPFRHGHWLSKKSFALRPPKLAEEFDIEPTDDEVWKKLGYPPKTLYHVEYFEGINEAVSKERQTARVRVHSDVFKKLTAESQQRMAKPILNGLAAEIACQMLVVSYADWEKADAVVANSPLSAFLKKIAKFQPCTLDDLKAMAKDPGTPKLRALLHADQQTVRSIAEA